MLYPSVQEVLDADRLQICRWFRFLPLADNSEETLLIHVLNKRYNKLGGMTPEISKTLSRERELR